MGTNTLIYAHRGASGIAPENTIAAFKRAIDMGSNGIEFDVQMTKDGELIVCHDERLERTTNGRGFIKDYTYEDIRSLDAGNWFSKGFECEKIPSLNEVLSLVKQANVLINIEIKSGIVIYPGIEEKVIKAVKTFGLEKNTIISSFNHYSIHKIKQLAPSIKCGVLFMEGLYEPWDYMAAIGCEYAHPFYLAIKPEMVKGLKEKRLGINAFTVDDIDYAKMLIAMGVDGIITNHPDRILKL